MIQLTDATLLINNEAIAIIPSSLKFTEGLGEQTMRAASTGGGETETVFSNNVETNISDLMFELPTTPENIRLARSWKTNQDRNAATIAGSTPEGDVTRTFTKAALVNNYEVAIGSETNIPIEFKANKTI